MIESVTTNQNIEQAVLAIKQAEEVVRLTTSWRTQIGEKVGYEDPLYTIAEKAVTETIKEVMRRKIALYNELEGSSVTYDEALGLEDVEQEQM